MKNDRNMSENLVVAVKLRFQTRLWTIKLPYGIIIDIDNNRYLNNLQQEGKMEENKNLQTDEAFVIRKKKRGPDPLPIVFAVLLCVCVVLTAILLRQISPERTVKREALKNYETFMQENRIMSELFDKETLDKIIAGEYSAEADVRIVNNNLYDKANGVSFCSTVDMAAGQREISGTLSGGLGGVNIMDMQFYGDKDNTEFYVPQIFKESFTLENKNVISQLEQVPVLGSKVKGLPDFDLDLFLVSDAANAANKLKKASWALWLLQKAGLVPSLEYSRAGRSTANDGKTYTAYTVTVPAKDAVDTVAGFFGGLADMAEYKEAVDKDTDLAYVIMPDAERSYGEKDAVKKQLSNIPAQLEKSLRELDMENVDISVVPVEGGIRFGLDQKFGDYAVKLNGDYDRTGNTLNISLGVNGGNIAAAFKYYDKCSKSGSVINETRIFDGTLNEMKISGSAEASYDTADKTLNAEFAAADGETSYSVKFDGKAERSGNTVKFTADSLTYTDGGVETEAAGSFTIGERTSGPEKINSSENIKIKDIGYIKALELYAEASDKLKALRSMLKIMS